MRILMFAHVGIVSLRNDSRILKEAKSLTEAGHIVEILIPDGAFDSTHVDAFGIQIKVWGIKEWKKHPTISDMTTKILRNDIIRKSIVVPLRALYRSGMTFDLYASYKMARVGMGIQADVYHSHDYPTLGYALFCARKNNGKLVYDSHELWSEVVDITAPRGANIRRIESRLIKQANAVITVNESIANELKTRYDIHKPTIIRNIPIFQEPSENFHLKNKLGIPTNAPVVIYLGRISVERGVLNIIDALEYLPDVHFVVLGKGPAVADLKQAGKSIPERMHFLEMVPPDQVVNIAACASIGIHPMLNVSLNNYYTLGNKIGDYIMAGLPIAVSDFPEMRKLAVDEDLGVVFDPESPKDIARAISELLDPETYDRMIDNVLVARKRYCWENEEKKLLELYSTLGDI